MKYRLLRSIQITAPNTGFVLSTGLVKNPLISPQFWNYMLDRYSIRTFRVAVLITPTKQSPWFHNSSAAGTDTKYGYVQTILSVLAHGSTKYFRNFVPWGIFSSSSSWSYSFLSDLTILIRIIIPYRPHASLWISAPFSIFLYISTPIVKPKLMQWPPFPCHRDMDSSAHIIYLNVPKDYLIISRLISHKTGNFSKTILKYPKCITRSLYQRVSPTLVLIGQLLV